MKQTFITLKKTFQFKTLAFLGAVLTFAFFGITASAYAAPAVSSAKITGPNTVTIVYSEPVTTSSADYTAFTGSLLNRSILGLSGSGTATINLNFDSSPLGVSAAGGLTISSGVMGLSSNQAFVPGVVAVTDGQAPIITSLTITDSTSNNTTALGAKVGDTIIVTFNSSESLLSPQVTIDGHTVFPGGSGSGPYSGNYTLISGDPQGSVTVAVTANDMAGNSAPAFKSTLILGSSSPVINSITSNANSSGVLTIGSSIVFTLTPSIPDPNLRISGSYNGTILGWSTSNSGSTYTATYNIQGGAQSQSSPLQITGVTATDSSGNVSAALSGNDVQKTISTNGPIITQVTPVTSPASATPSYTFNSTEAGNIVLTGDCSSGTAKATVGSNTITFNTLGNGDHPNCTLKVIDSSGLSSNTIFIPNFTVGTSTTSSTPTPAPTPSPTPSTASTTQKGDGFVFTKNLASGDVNNDVTELQKRITAEGLYTGPITGKFAAQTKASVKAYQKAHGVNSNGNVGPATRAALNGK